MNRDIKNIEPKEYKKGKSLKPVAIIALSFLIVILIGSIFLILPISINEGQNVTYLDALFTSTSATCVTGLVSLANGTAASFTLFGRIIIAILIQLGGLGVTTLAVVFFMIASNKLTFNEQSLIKESWNLQDFKGLKKVFLEVLMISFGCELLGAILTFFDLKFVHNMELAESIGYAVFHSVSAFNNAGFDLFGTTSLIEFENDIFMNLITAGLIIMGGIGYFVIIDTVAKKFNFKKLSLHSKIALSFTAFLIVFGSVILYLTELNNESTTSFMGSFFMSVSARTAGFSMYDLSKFRDASLIILNILMFIGASPGGTGGGIKTTTFVLLLCYLRGVMVGKDPHAFKRNISKALIRKALLIILLGLIFVITGIFLITVFEGNVNYIKDGVPIKDYVDGCTRFDIVDYTFEAFSAFGTVGLSTGFTPYFTIGSKIVLIVLMYVGRIGPLTISTAWSTTSQQTYHYVEEDVSIG